MAFHVRSASVPSSPSSNDINADEQLQSLSTTITSSSATMGTVCGGLRKLGEIYNYISELVCLPSSQVPNRGNQWSKSLSARLSCSAFATRCKRASLSSRKSILDMQLALKRGDNAAVQTKIQSYICIAKKTQKQFKNISKKSAAADQESCKLIKMMSEARGAAFLMLESSSQLLSKQIAVPSPANGLSSPRCSRREELCVEQLQALELDIVDLESGVETFFRILIQSRVSL